MANPAPQLFVDSSGNLTPVPPEQAQGAAQMGWVPASEKQVADFQAQEKYGTTGQEAITALEAAGSALSFGLSTHVEKHLGVPKEDIVGREQANPGAHMLGTAAGIGGSLLTGVGAPGAIAKLGQATAKATVGLGRIAASAAGSAIEGAAYGLGQVVHESALGDPAEVAQSALATVGLSAALMGGLGMAGGVVAQGFKEIGPADIGSKLKMWMGEFEGERNIKAAGARKTDITRLRKQLGRDSISSIGREAGEAGYVGPLSTPASTVERTDEALRDIGPQIGAMTKAADAEGIAPSIEDVVARAQKEILAPLAFNPLEAGAAKQVHGFLESYEQKFANGMTYSDLHEMEQQIGQKIYGLRGTLDPDAKVVGSALHDLRSVVSDELETGMDKVLGKSEEWKTLRRQYHVAKTINRIAENAQDAEHGNNLVSLTEGLSAGMGMIHGGPLGAAAVGLGTAALRRHSAGALGWAARTLRGALEDAPSVAGKTAEAVQASRQAGTDTVFQQATNQPEAVAALSILERMQQAVNNKIETGISAVVRGGEGAGIARVFSKPHEDATAIYSKRVEELQRFAQNPDQLQKALEAQTGDWHEHAPNTAQAMQITSATGVNFLASKVSQLNHEGMIQRQWSPSRAEVSKFNRYWEAVENPASILRQAASGTLTPEALEAVGTVYPALLTKMRMVATEKLAWNKDIPYRSRLMLSMLLGRDVDGSTNPNSILRNQLIMAPKPAMPAKPTGFKSKRAERTMTETQASKERGAE